MAVTIKDIAKKAGINTGSVSHVLNNHPKALELKLETRERILAVAREMGYSRNELARAVATGHNRIIAFISGDMGIASYTGKIQEGVFAEAGSNGYAVLFYHLTDDNHQYLVGEIRKWRVAGVVFHVSGMSKIRDICSELESFGIPFAFANLESDGSSAFGVTSDDFQGAVDMARHLTELGHRRIAHVTNNDDSAPAFVVNRRAGYLEGMRRFAPGCVPRIVMTTPEAAEADVLRLLSEPEATRPTALFFYMDSWAMLSFRAVARLGLRIPDDLSVAGFGDMDMAEYAPVSLTTVRQPFREMGKMAVGKILESINFAGMLAIENIRLGLDVIVRKSTGGVCGNA